MKNWQVIMWLFLFFPVGVYFMFKYSDWPKSIKYWILALVVMIAFLVGWENWMYLFFIGSLGIIVVGLVSVITNKDKRKMGLTLGLGALLLFSSGSMITAYVAEVERLEQIEIEKQAKAEAEEARLAEEARIKEEERIQAKIKAEAQKTLKRQVETALDRVEETPTKTNYDNAEELLQRLESNNVSFTTRLKEVKPVVEAYEEELTLVKEVILKAESEKNRGTYDEASLAIASLSIPSESFNRRLEKLDTELIKIEEEQRVAAEKAAEEERIRVAKVEEEAQRQAAAASQQSAATVQAQPVQPPAPVQVTQGTVYIAPQSGTKYHYYSGCRGLSKANSIQEMSLSEAQGLGYGLCGWED